jgi:hypothetical protein
MGRTYSLGPVAVGVEWCTRGRAACCHHRVHRRRRRPSLSNLPHYPTSVVYDQDPAVAGFVSYGGIARFVRRVVQLEARGRRGPRRRRVRERRAATQYR